MSRISKKMRLELVDNIKVAIEIIENGKRGWLDRSCIGMFWALIPILRKTNPNLADQLTSQFSSVVGKEP